MPGYELPLTSTCYQVAVFDCDGVILDSNRIKSEAFRAAVQGESPELIDQFVAYHQANGGVSRYVKFAHFYRELAPRPEAEQAACVAAALARYAAIVREQLCVCPCIPGVEAFLQRLYEAGVPCYVNSGGDQAELREVFAERGLARWFRGIYGSPATKQDHLRELQEAGNLPAPGVFFGDARSDYLAAEAFGLDFVFVHGHSEWREGAQFCAEHELPQIRSFLDLLS